MKRIIFILFTLGLIGLVFYYPKDSSVKLLSNSHFVFEKELSSALKDMKNGKENINELLDYYRALSEL